MIIRAWRGWATGERAAEYGRLLNGTIAPAIMRRGVDGLHELVVLRRVADEVTGEEEFLTLMTFEDRDAVGRFAGPDPAASVVPAAARALLDRFDAHSRHYEVLHRHRGAGAGETDA